MIKANITNCENAPIIKGKYLRSRILVEDEDLDYGWTAACENDDCDLCKALIGEEMHSVLENGRLVRVIGKIERV